MYRKLAESGGALLAYAIEGRLERDDVERLQTELRTAAREHGPLRVLVRLDGLDAMTPAAVWQDATRSPAYVDDVERLAVVGDERWHGWVAGLSSPFADVEHFPPEQVSEALDWLRTG